MYLTNSLILYAPVNLSVQYGCLKLVQFSKKSGRLSSTGSEILTFGSRCSTNFQPILDCFIPKFKLKYDDLENIKTASVSTVVFNLHQIKRLKFFWGHPVDGKSWTQHILLSHFRPPGGFLPHLVSFYPTWRILPLILKMLETH